MVKPISVFKKICVVGDNRAGKTAIVNRFVSDKFTEEYTPSIGTKVSKRNVEIKDPSGQTQGLMVNMMIWDLLGSREHANLHKAFYAGSEGAIVVCDLASPGPLEHLDFWVENLRAVVPKNTPIFLALNKTDAVAKEVKDRTIQTIREQCRKLNIAHIEVSARTGDNIQNMFYTLSEAMMVARPF